MMKQMYDDAEADRKKAENELVRWKLDCQCDCRWLRGLSVTPSELLLYLLVNESSNQDQIYHHFREDATCRASDILTALQYSNITGSIAEQWLCHNAVHVYSDAVSLLARKERGWHFSAVNTRAEQIQDFRIEDMRAEMERATPHLWALVYNMVGGSDDGIDTCNMSAEDDDEEDAALWDAFPALATGAFNTSESGGKGVRNRAVRRELAVIVSDMLFCIILIL